MQSEHKASCHMYTVNSGVKDTSNAQAHTCHISAHCALYPYLTTYVHALEKKNRQPHGRSLVQVWQVEGTAIYCKVCQAISSNRSWSSLSNSCNLSSDAMEHFQCQLFQFLSINTYRFFSYRPMKKLASTL